MRVEWSRWRGLGVTGRISPRFAHLCGQADAGHVPAANAALPGRDTILAADPEGRPALVGALLRDKVARVLGTSPRSARRRQAAPAARHRFAHGRRAAQLARGRAPGRLADRGADAKPQRVGPRQAACGTARDGRQRPHYRSRPQRSRSQRGTVTTVTTATSDCPLQAAPAELLARIDDLSGDQVDALLAALLDEKGHGHGR